MSSKHLLIIGLFTATYGCTSAVDKDQPVAETAENSFVDETNTSDLGTENAASSTPTTSSTEGDNDDSGSLPDAKPPINVTGAHLVCQNNDTSGASEQESPNHRCDVTGDDVYVTEQDVSIIEFKINSETESVDLTGLVVTEFSEGRLNIQFPLPDALYSVKFEVSLSVSVGPESHVVRNDPESDFLRRYTVICNRIVGNEELTSALAVFGCAIVRPDSWMLSGEDLSVITDWSVGFYNEGLVAPILATDVTPYSNDSEWHVKFNIPKTVLTDTLVTHYQAAFAIDGVAVTRSGKLYSQELVKDYTEALYDEVIGIAWNFELFLTRGSRRRAR